MTRQQQPDRATPKHDAKQERRVKAAAARDAARRAERRRTWLLRGSVAAVVVALVAIAAAVVVPAVTPRAVALPVSPAATGTDTPPWAVPADPSAGIDAAALSISAMTADGAHFHTHLDIQADGQSVPVPANIGISATTGAMSELHTHDTSGIVHIESSTNGNRYVLGQLFTEWGVRLTRTQVGGLTTAGGRTLAAFVDGKPYLGDPARIELTAHREIALVFGTAGQQKNVPRSYSFPSGE